MLPVLYDLIVETPLEVLFRRVKGGLEIPPNRRKRGASIFLVETFFVTSIVIAVFSPPQYNHISCTVRYSVH